MTNIGKWIEQNGRSIEATLDDYASAHVYMGRPHKRAFPLSDLGLCGVVRRGSIQLPEPYYVQRVSVLITPEPLPISHYVGFDGSHILDFVSGQFLRNDARKISGIALMLQIAPQLFHIFSDELTVLHATAEEIYENLKLEYQIS